jgi:hypothetical protein
MLRTFELPPMIALNFPASLLVTMPLRVMHVDPLAREGEEATSICDAWDRPSYLDRSDASAMAWRQAAFDLDDARVLNHEHRPAVFGWSHAASGGGQVA